MEGSEIFSIINVDTHNYLDQNPGTSGLRKKVSHFAQKHYLENFVQAIFDSHSLGDFNGKSLVVGGDGRYYNDVAINTIIKISSANGISKILIPQNGLMSTPAISLFVRNENKESLVCFGAIILTASHNPGGKDEDFGIKFNNSAGAPATENITNKIFENTKKMKIYKTLNSEKTFNLETDFSLSIEGTKVEVKIVSSTELYKENMKQLFDFDKIKKLFSRKDFSFVFDGLHGVSGPYAVEIFKNEFGVKTENLLNCDNLPDFGGHHPDPNLVYAKTLVEKMDIAKKVDATLVPDFGAACDGDADRNMILGKQFFISPSDSIAIIAAQYKSIKYLNQVKGLRGVARSMPTSSALDRVAHKLGLKCYETPTGWKFFGNLMDAGLISLCGEESFGTGSDHIREKDGIWAILCWLSILASKNENNNGQLIGIESIALEHWKSFGRDYYCRYDYENISIDQSKEVIAKLVNSFEVFEKAKEGNKAFIFEYTDCVDHSISKNQGWVFAFKDGSRIIFRVSGTSSTGATLRIYFEKHIEPNGDLNCDTLEMIKSDDNNLVEIAMNISNINNITGRTGPTIIT